MIDLTVEFGLFPWMIKNFATKSVNGKTVAAMTVELESRNFSRETLEAADEYLGKRNGFDGGYWDIYDNATSPEAKLVLGAILEITGWPEDRKKVDKKMADRVRGGYTGEPDAVPEVRTELEAMKKVGLISAAKFKKAIARVEANPDEVRTLRKNGMKYSEIADLILSM